MARDTTAVTVPNPLAAIPGTPETAVGAALLGSLPDSSPAPPWRCRVEAVVWWHRAAPGARAVLPPALRDQAGLALTVGAFVRYLDSPVGPYDEVLAAPHLLGPLPRLHVPFIAVDSAGSVHGGRAHWALPKVLASFTRSPVLHADGGTWWVSADARPGGPELPVPARVRATQVDGDGRVTTSTTTGRARLRVARVVVDVDPGSSLAGWLLPGRHRGAVLTGRITVGPAR